MDQMVGLWLDYWLFLHAEDAHPIWCSRPLGLKSLARVVLNCRSASDWGMRVQVKREIARMSALVKDVHGIPPPPDEDLSADGSMLGGSWLAWTERIHNELAAKTILEGIVTALEKALTEQRVDFVMYLTRRLAGELGGSGWSGRQLLGDVWDAFLANDLDGSDSVEVASVGPTLRRLFVAPTRRNYAVVFGVAPVRVTSGIVKNLGSGRQLVVEQDGEALRLTGILVKVEGTCPDEAVRRAHPRATAFIDTLRVSYYVRTTMHGYAKVTNLATLDESWIALPHPFWERKPKRRPVPTLPVGFADYVRMLPSSDAARWHAARWHLSQAISDWPEDVHSAAAKIWQSLEAFVPGGKNALSRVQDWGGSYLGLLPERLVAYLARRLSAQAYALRLTLAAEGKPSDWYYWDNKRVPLLTWYGRVLDERSERHISKWQVPRIFDMLGADRVGLLHVTGRVLRTQKPQQWMITRLKDDLALLYGLRNRIVHSGDRVFPNEMASYLAGLGSEMLFDIMNASIAGLKSGQRLPDNDA